ERYFTYLTGVQPYMEEGLLIPFYVGGQAVGTIWVMAHDQSRRFDAEDLRVMTNLAHFAAAAYAARTRQVAVRADVNSALATEEVANDARLSDPDWAPAEGMVAFAGYPLLVGGQAVGVLAMFSRKPISQATVETLSTIADTIAQGVQRAQGAAALRRSEAFLT